MSQFNTEYQGRKVVVDYAAADDPKENLEGVIICYCRDDAEVKAGDEIDYNAISDEDFARLQSEVWANFQEWQAESVAGWD